MSNNALALAGVLTAAAQLALMILMFKLRQR
jgi:hypothetical protein